MAGNARETAVQALMSCRKSGAWSDAALNSRINKAGLDARDGALAAKLCYGVLQNSTLLDFYLQHFCHTPLEKLEPRVLDILRISVYQMVFLTRIPHSAAVDEAVKLTKAIGCAKAAGLVNAVLRKVSAAGDRLPQVPRDNAVDYLTIRYSHPSWLVERMIDRLGPDGAEALLGANNEETALYAQVNTLKADTDSVLETLEVLDVEAERHPWLADCLTLKGTGNLEQLPPFAEGKLYIQDPAARLAILAANPAQGSRLLDICGAPGGKSFASAIHMGDRGEITTCDIQEKKLGRVQAGAQRLGIQSISTQARDGRAPDTSWKQCFDTVLTDVPCSGLGIIRKKPEIRQKRPEDIARLPEIQLAILRNCADFVTPGGVLLYSTCTILEEENEAVVRAFLQDNPDFVPEGFTLPGPAGTVEEGQITLYPHIHGTDGFYFCKLRRVSQ